MNAQQNKGAETPTSIPAAEPMTAYSDTVSVMDGCTVSTDESQVKASTIQLPATCKQSDLSAVSLASSTSAFKSLTQSTLCQTELNEDNLKHVCTTAFSCLLVVYHCCFRHQFFVTSVRVFTANDFT